MLGRVPIHDVQSLNDVMAFVESTHDENVVIFDVDNTLAPQGCALGDFALLVDASCGARLARWSTNSTARTRSCMLTDSTGK